MPYYDTIEEDLARAKAIVARRGKWKVSREEEQRLQGLSTIAADRHAAYGLLASFVAEIERLRAESSRITWDDQGRRLVNGQLGPEHR